jgi:hypothetical protein
MRLTYFGKLTPRRCSFDFKNILVRINDAPVINGRPGLGRSPTEYTVTAGGASLPVCTQSDLSETRSGGYMSEVACAQTRTCAGIRVLFCKFGTVTPAQPQAGPGHGPGAAPYAYGCNGCINRRDARSDRGCTCADHPPKIS